MRFKFKSIKSLKGNVFLRRLTLYIKSGSIKLHIITGDDSEVYHTHPWDFKSLILFGGYREYSKPVYYGQMDVYGHIVNCTVPQLVEYQTKNYRMFSINKKLHYEEHRVELFKVLGFKIPCITIGKYSKKLQLCSFCKDVGYCKANKPN